MITALLCVLVKRVIPSATALLYANDTLPWLPGGKEQVQCQLREVKKVMQEYAEYTGQEMNLGRSKIVLQGDWEDGLDILEGFEVATTVRYLGLWLGGTGRTPPPPAPPICRLL